MRLPRQYLEEIYSGELDVGSRCLMEFYAEVYQNLDGASLLEFGGGPTLYAVLSAARYSGPLHFVDTCELCLEEVRSWLRGDPKSFDWSIFTRCALQSEEQGADAIGASDISDREALVRKKIERIDRCDAYSEDVLLGSSLAPYGAIASNFCLDGITDNLDTWVALNRRLTSLLGPNGLFVTAAVRRGRFWGTGGECYPAVSLTLDDLKNLYKSLGFGRVAEREVNLTGRDGYDGLIMIAGRRGPSRK